MSTNRRRREILYRRDPHCYWCGIKTNPRKTGPNQATLDHLRSRYHPDRLEPNDGKTERTVLACWLCNHVRNVAEQILLGSEYLRQRSEVRNYERR